MEKKNLYISMTVLPERLVSSFFTRVIASLKVQTARADKIIINIPWKSRRTGIPYVIPDWLALDQPADSSIRINRCEDLGPATKLLGIYSELRPDDLVCVVDDDIIYQPTMLQTLLDAHHRQPDALVSTTLDRQGSPTGYSGYLFQRRFLDINPDDITDLLEHCYCVDDTWLGKILRKKSVAITGISNDWRASMDQAATDTHPAWFELCKQEGRDELIRRCLCSESAKGKPGA